MYLWYPNKEKKTANYESSYWSVKAYASNQAFNRTTRILIAYVTLYYSPTV